MSQQSELADYVYAKLSRTELPASYLVHVICEKWGSIANPSTVHLFVAESVACLLRNEDIEVGDVIEGKFIPWLIKPWDAAQKIEDEICSLGDYLADESQYVFRKITEPNQARK